MSLLVAVADWDAQPWVERFQALLPRHEIVTPQTLSAPQEVRYVASWRHAPGALSALPGLRAIFSLGAGVDHLFADPQLPDVPLVRIVDAELTERMSEYIVLHVLAHHRQQRMYEWQQEQKLWDDDLSQPAAREVRIGVLGLGAMGADAARKLAMMGFDVAGWSRSPKALAGVICFDGPAGLNEMLARSDILICLLPLTPQTRGLLNLRLFSKLAHDGRLGGPILINAARGGLQVESDILEALAKGVLKAATLDVFQNEPLPETSPLWTNPRIAVTPHNAAISAPDAVASNIAKQIEAFERGEALRNLVDRGRGY